MKYTDFVFSMLLIITGSVVFSARPWPDTTADIYVFTDQIPTGMTSNQIHFAATHLAGSQKLTRDILDPIREINPNFILLDYILGFGIGEFSHPEGYEWVDDPYDDLDLNHPDFFLTHPSSTHPHHRIFQTDWHWWVLDVQQTSYQNWFVNECLRRRQLNLSDGIFADSCSYPWNTDPAQWWPDGSDQFTFWDPRMNSYLSAVHTAFASESNPFYFIANAGGLVTTVSLIDYTLADGVMVEQFAMWEPGSPFDLSDWELQMNRILDLQNASKTVLCQNYMDSSDLESRMFYTACYLLCKGNQCYLSMLADFGLEWYPEYDLPIGSYSSIPGTISELYDSGAGLFIRSFSNGLALVNPSNSDPIPYTLDHLMYAAIASGGGVVPENGVPTGHLTYESVTSVDLGPYEAIILIESQDPNPTPTPNTGSAGVQLSLSSSYFSANDHFLLQMTFHNDSSAQMPVDAYLVLEVYGHYYFWPDWNENLNSGFRNLVPGAPATETIFDFLWPNVSGTASGLTFYAVITHPGTYNLAGSWDYVSFSY